MKTSAIAIALITFLTAAAPALGHQQHGHASYSQKPARTIEVLMNEMDFTPARIEVKRGEQVRFVLRNIGTEDHEFLLATTAENLKHAELMKKFPHMEHDDPNGVRLAPKKTAELVWKFTKAGTFEYSCLIPNHRDSGMIGHVTVK
jgi:uncharacterized cupredoxin-like copper-binding protein